VEQKLKKETIKIGGIDCVDCARRLEKYLRRKRGITEVTVDVVGSRLEFKYDPNTTRLDEVERQISGLGFSVESETGERKTELLIEGLDCFEEEQLIRKGLAGVDGISGMEFDFGRGSLSLLHTVPIKEIVERIEQSGFKVHRTSGLHDKGRSMAGRRRLILTILCGVFAVSGAITDRVLPGVLPVLLYSLAVLSGGYYVARRAVVAVRQLSLDMNFLMTIAVVGAFLLGKFEEGAMVVFLFSVANLLEAYSMDRSSRAVKALMDLSPRKALVRRDGDDREVDVEDVRVGELVVAKPGARIPVDGVVTQGESSVDESTVTGESSAVRKEPGSEVLSGTLNLTGFLLLEASRLASESTVARIAKLVESARNRKAPIERFVDVFSKYYTPLVVLAAILLAIVPPLVMEAAWRPWIYRALVMLVIACPCALVISTPVTMVSGLTRAARSGILVKGSAFLEAIAKIKVFALDKTGTITRTDPRVLEVFAFPPEDERRLLEITSSIEARSQHPIAEAIVDFARQRGVGAGPVETLQEVSGRGVKGVLGGRTYYIGSHALLESVGMCDEKMHGLLARIEKEGQTAVLVGSEGRLIGILTVSDTIRPETRSAVREMKNRYRLRLVMLTGDNHRTANAVAQSVGIDDVRAELLPEDKLDSIRSLKEAYGSVAMVGDGVNDAPALALSTVGIAVGTGANDVALEAGDIALVADDLSGLPYLVRLSKSVLSITKQNIFLAIAIKAVFLALAAQGLATLWMAVFADMGTSLLVIFNGLRVLRVRRSGTRPGRLDYSPASG